MTSRPSSVTPAASQPRIMGSRSAGRPTPRSDQMSWRLRASGLHLHPDPAGGTPGGSISPTTRASKRRFGIRPDSVGRQHALHPIGRGSRGLMQVASAIRVRLQCMSVSNAASAPGRAPSALRPSRQPAGVWAAPGRVNLIGEHTDYNDGYVMPFALAQRVLIAAAPRQRSASGAVTSLNNHSTEDLPGRRPATRDDGLAGVRRRCGLGPRRRPGTGSAEPTSC